MNRLFRYGISAACAVVFLSIGTPRAIALSYEPDYIINVNQSDLAAFRYVKEINPIQKSYPIIVEIPLPQLELQQQPFVVYDVGNNQSVYHVVQQNSPQSPQVRIGLENSPKDLPQLYDNNQRTEFEVPVEGQEKGTTFVYSTGTPITASQVRITFTQNAIRPSRFSIYRENPPGSGQWEVVLSNLPYGTDTILFPPVQSSRWRIGFLHTQPLRIAEIEIPEDYPVSSNGGTLRFLAQPNKYYRIYSSPDRSVYIPTGEYTNLTDPASDIMRIANPLPSPNPLYQRADIDADGIIDVADNCPNIVNSDQVDINSNGQGDACEDFDHDGVMNNVDNCVNNPNSQQQNADGDQLGDVCDPDESRFTERFFWLPWLGIVVGFATVFGIFYTTSRSKKSGV